MHILVTNDDGVTAPGLLALAEAAKPFGKVSIIAPDKNWSVTGHSKTLNHPLRAVRTSLHNGMPAFACDGSPADCVSLGYLGFLDEPVDLVLSGINPNANLSHDITYSGTVTAAMEAVVAGITGLAFSLDRPNGSHGEVDFKPAASIAARVIEKCLNRKFPPFTLLNVNIPYLPLEEIKGFKITRQGTRVYRDKLVSRLDPMNRPYYWIGGEPPSGIPEDGTDIGELANGYVSVTPLHLDLTAHDFMPALNQWGWEKG